MVWKMIFLFQGCILRFHVNLPRCIPYLDSMGYNWCRVPPCHGKPTYQAVAGAQHQSNPGCPNEVVACGEGPKQKNTVKVKLAKNLGIFTTSTRGQLGGCLNPSNGYDSANQQKTIRNEGTTCTRWAQKP